MHVIVVNNKDLGFSESQTDSSPKKSSDRSSTSGISEDLLIDSSDGVDFNKTPVKKKGKSLAEMIPAFGILLSILSVICFSVGSLIVKVLTELHSLEILFVR